MSELAFKNRVVRLIKKEFPDVFFYKSHDQFTSGIPDIIGCLKGIFWTLELKFGKGKATRLQLHVMKKIQDAGGFAGVARTIQEVRDFLRRVESFANRLSKGG